MIIDTPAVGTDARERLDRAAERCRLECKVIQAAAQGSLCEITDLLGANPSRWTTPRPLSKEETVARFESRLTDADNRTLRELVGLLAMPDHPKPTL